mgnify:CR=1 FL=1
MVYLDFSAALLCWASLDAYRWEGRRQLLVDNLKLDGGLDALPDPLPAQGRKQGRVSAGDQDGKMLVGPLRPETPPR